METLGVDIGGVIIERGEGSADTSFFSRHYLSTPMVPDAFDALRVLNAERFPGRVFLVSKCGARIQARTLAWLQHHDFHAYTGIPVERVHFCRQRPDKAGIC